MQIQILDFNQSHGFTRKLIPLCLGYSTSTNAIYIRRSPRYRAVFPAPSHELELAELSSAISLKQITATSGRTTLPLCSQLPYSVDWQVALDRIILIGGGAENVVPANRGA